MVAAGGQRWWGWHMTWREDQWEGVLVRKKWGGELPGGGKGTGTVPAHFTGATLTPAPTKQGHRVQELVYMLREDTTLKEAEAIKMALDEGAAHMANRTYHVHLHTGKTWHYALPGDDGMASILPFRECERHGNGVSALAKVAEEWVREAGGAKPAGETGTKWTVGATQRARYCKGEWMTREDTGLIFAVAPKGLAVEQCRGQAGKIMRQGDGGVGGTPWTRGKVQVQCTGA